MYFGYDELDEFEGVAEEVQHIAACHPVLPECLVVVINRLLTDKLDVVGVGMHGLELEGAGEAFVKGIV